MTINTSFYDNSSYNSAELNAPWASLLSNGVFNVAGGGLAVTQNSTPNMTVNVAAGALLFNGYYINNTASISVPITANTSGNNRYDIIVANTNTSTQQTTFIAVMGTPSSSPTVPLPAANQIVIANVYVGNNVSVINTSNITDVRNNTGFKDITAQITLDGYFKEPKTGLILQWGINAIPANGTIGTTTFPVQFPNNCFQVVATLDTVLNISVSVANINKTNFCMVQWNSSNQNGRYFAIGN